VGATDPVAVACAGGALFDLTSAEPLRRDEREFAVRGDAFAFAVAEDGQSFAVGGSDAIVQWWSEGRAKERVLRVDGVVAALAFQPDGKALLVSTRRGSQTLHGVDGTTTSLAGDHACVQEFTVSPDGTVVAVRGNDWFVQPVLGGAPRLLRDARAVRPGRRGNELLVSWNTRSAVIDGDTARQIVAVDASNRGFSSDAVGPGDKIFCDGENALVDAVTGARIPVPADLYFHGVISVAHSRDGTWAAGACEGNRGEFGSLWATDAHGRTLHSQRGVAIDWLSFSPDGKHFYYARESGDAFRLPRPATVLCVLDTTTFQLVRETVVRLTSWQFLDDAHALVATNGELQVWDVATLRPVQTVATATPVHWFQLAADARTIAWSNRREVLVHRVHRVD
jgi:WD40 repeat protein